MNDTNKTLTLPQLLDSWQPQQDLSTFAVLCLNCENYIDVQQINGHSSECYRLTDAVFDTDSKPTLDCSLAKLGRLSQMLEDLIAKAHVPREKNYLAVLLRVCEKAAECRLCASVKDLDRYLESLEANTLHSKVSIGVQICADRLKALIELHKAALIELDQDNKVSQIKQLKSEVQSYLTLTQKLERDLTRLKHLKVEQVNSELCSIKSLEVSEIFSDETDEDRSFYLTGLDFDRDIEESQKQGFYSIALSCKMAQPLSHPARKVPVSKIYRLSQQKGVLPENWKDFIMSFFERLSLDISSTSRVINAITEGDEQDSSFS